MTVDVLISAGTASDLRMQTVRTALTTLQETTMKYRDVFAIPIGTAKAVSSTRTNHMPHLLETVTLSAWEDVQVLLQATVSAVLKELILINLEHVFVICITAESLATSQ